MGRVFSLSSGLWLAAVACGGELPPQLVRGTLAATTPGADHVKAWSNLGLAALAPIDDKGDFLLALPVGGPYRLEIDDRASSSPIPFNEPSLPASSPVLKVCTPRELHDLGTVHFVPLGCGTGNECPMAERELWRCKADPGFECDMLRQELDACLADPNRCEPMTPDGCPEFCGQLAEHIDARCAAPCDAQAQAVDAYCRGIMNGDPSPEPGRCPSASAAVTETPLPTSFGCRDEGLPFGM